MEGTLVVQEERKTIDRFRDWYQQKVVDTHYAENFENWYAKKVEINKSLGEFKEVVCITVLSFFPEVSFMIPFIKPLREFGDKVSDVELALVVGGKRFIEGKFLDVDGSSKDVEIPDFNIEEIANDAAGLLNQTTSAYNEAGPEKTGGATK